MAHTLADIMIFILIAFLSTVIIFSVGAISGPMMSSITLISFCSLSSVVVVVASNFLLISLPQFGQVIVYV